MRLNWIELNELSTKFSKQKMWRHILVTKRHIPGSMWRCQVSKKLFLMLPKMWPFSWNWIKMWRFRHIVTSFVWVRLGTNLSLKTQPGPGFWVPGSPISAWNDPQFDRVVKLSFLWKLSNISEFEYMWPPFQISGISGVQDSVGSF